ncbi:MAG: hypothetical protein J7J07_08470 [Syntrophobacterales bacterium]|nr:hypothetical protein [Syntrophobacterales bacterium]
MSFALTLYKVLATVHGFASPRLPAAFARQTGEHHTGRSMGTRQRLEGEKSRR